MSAFEERAEVVIDLFRDVFDCSGQRFGSLSLGLLGISDGREGVQWNAAYFRSEQTASLGVNLEGMKYDDWPVARLIERELSQPLLLTEYRARVARPEMVTVRWHRDAWQAAIRVPIKESSLDPTPIALHRLGSEGWKRALRSARECLNPKRGYRGRRRTKVTLRRSGQVVERQVTPHLHFEMCLASPHSVKRDERRATSRRFIAGPLIRHGLWSRDDASSAPLHSISTMLGRLNTLYASHGISPVDFRCPSYMACSADSSDFTTAKASFIGPAMKKGSFLAWSSSRWILEAQIRIRGGARRKQYVGKSSPEMWRHSRRTGTGTALTSWHLNCSASSRRISRSTTPGSISPTSTVRNAVRTSREGGRPTTRYSRTAAVSSSEKCESCVQTSS